MQSGQGQNRTADTRIFSPLLYQLSYLAQQNADTQLSVLSGLTAESAGKNLAAKRTQNQAEDVTRRRRVKVVMSGRGNCCVAVAKSRQFMLAAMKTGVYISAALTKFGVGNFARCESMPNLPPGTSVT